MPCACKVNKQMAYLAKHFGMVKEQNNKKSNVSRKVKNILIGTGITILTIPLLPITLIAIPFLRKKNGSISIKNLLYSKKYVRN